ncbi:Inositol-1-monophosphatase SuhB [Corynebacterium cystitidis DSM 20524]|uniref:Inositol-1-monophosphatase n=2 Tax=Corynebacterium cystitidis TaxID=35757 RepID=A0A1H9P9L6_9CORY|nr:Inositol-1-monophosphatase SuhB [Corynebacterium cystitidis DSM 20524]SER44934.1 myo-inositol-1(or 4)-monophosphatase [Corynebacterium cystitidis DSM 20524]SNV73276.1 inositol monophosphatase [Corynebacterium cystitidis]
MEPMSNTSVPTPAPSELRDLAISIAREAGDLVRSRRAELAGDRSAAGLRAATTLKSSAVDPVTIVDQASETYIVDRISRARPDDGFIGEEGSSKESATGVEWIVDPIDGTVNFLYDIPVYAVSIGVALQGELIAGAVLNVATQELYYAASGEGAFRTSEGTTAELRVNDVVDTRQAMVATGFGYTSGRRAAQAEVLTKVLPHVRDIRRMGAAALDFCHLASGRIDAYYEHGLHPWDFAAGAVIAREAGAHVEVPALRSSGDDGEVVIATAPGITDSFYQLLESGGGRKNLPK